MSRRALFFFLFFLATGTIRALNGYSSVWYWLFVFVFFLLIFRDAWAYVTAWVLYVFIKLLPTRWATEKRKKGYSNYK